jgi:single-strand DNA-binding protein
LPPTILSIGRKKYAKKINNIHKIKKIKDRSSDYHNQVALVGRLSGEPKEKVLPSGSKVVEFRLVVERDKGFSGSKQLVDTIDIAIWSALGRRSALKLDENDWISVNGAIRRRFWQSPTGLASRWQVEASEINSI